MTKSIFEQLPGMKLMFGKTFYEDFINQPEDSLNKRKIIIGEVCKSISIVINKLDPRQSNVHLIENMKILD